MDQYAVFDVLERFDYNSAMSRPRKASRLRMDTDLRIPVTIEQKRIVAEATADEPEGMAAWARLVLLDAARRKLAKVRSALTRTQKEKS
jgi:hypothetical protein